VSLDAQNALSTPIVGRAAAYADIDHDGDLDVILTQIGKPPKLLRNDQTSGHNWVQFDLRDETGAPALGASIELVTAEVHQYGRVEPTRSYLTQVESILSFGIAKRNKIDRVSIQWPHGSTLTINDPAINQRHRIQRSSPNSD